VSVDDPRPDVPTPWKGAMHLQGLRTVQGPPYVCFERHSDKHFAAWLSTPPTVDMEELNRRIGDPEDAVFGRTDDLFRAIAEYFGYALSPDENGLLARYEAQDTGPDFWADVEAAGLLYLPEPEGKRPPKTTRPQGPRAVGTYPELAALGAAAADARTGAYWIEEPGGGALVHIRKKAGLQIRFMPSVGGDRWADPAPGTLSADLFATLAANGGLDTVFLAHVGADFAVYHEHEDVTLDDLGRLIGRDPRTTRDREAMRRDLWERLKFLDGLTVWGMRKGTYRDPVTHEKVPIESRDELFRIGGTMWPEQSTLDGSDVPLVVSFAAGPLLAKFRGEPAILTTYGEFRRLAEIPGEKPSGAWARSIGLALTQRWRELASYGRAQKLTRRYLLTQFRPAPTVDEVLAGRNPQRARTYFTQALALLKTAGVIAAYTEPDPKMLPRTGWAKVWLGQTVDVTQPAAVIEAGEGMQARRAELIAKMERRRKRPRRKRPK